MKLEQAQVREQFLSIVSPFFAFFVVHCFLFLSALFFYTPVHRLAHILYFVLALHYGFRFFSILLVSFLLLLPSAPLPFPGFILCIHIHFSAPLTTRDQHHSPYRRCIQRATSFSDCSPMLHAESLCITSPVKMYRPRPSGEAQSGYILVLLWNKLPDYMHPSPVFITAYYER